MNRFYVLFLAALLSGCQSVPEGEKKEVSDMVEQETDKPVLLEWVGPEPIDPQDTTDIPAVVRRAAQEYCRDGYFLLYCGMPQNGFDQTEVYRLIHPSRYTGLSTVYLRHGNQVVEIAGTGALRLLDQTRKVERKPRRTTEPDDPTPPVPEPPKAIPYQVLEAAYTGWLVQYIGRTADGAAVYRAFPEDRKEPIREEPAVLVWEKGLLQEYWGERAMRGMLDEVVDRKEIPAAVLAEHDRHKGSLDWPLEYIGHGADGAEVYILKTPIGSDTGLPNCYTWKEGRVTEVFGSDALELLQTVKPRD